MSSHTSGDLGRGSNRPEAAPLSVDFTLTHSDTCE